MNFEEKTKQENLIFDGKVLHVYCDDIIRPDGKAAKREYAKHLGAVCVVPLTGEGRDNRVYRAFRAGRLREHLPDMQGEPGKFFWRLKMAYDITLRVTELA